jgi:hypothetical protein
MDATRRHLVGLAMMLDSYEPMSITILPHVVMLVNDLGRENDSWGGKTLSVSAVGQAANHSYPRLEESMQRET